MFMTYCCAGDHYPCASEGVWRLKTVHRVLKAVDDGRPSETDASAVMAMKWPHKFS